MILPWGDVIQNEPSSNSVVYISLDTVEGRSCVGHWIWECGLFLPYIDDLRRNLTVPLKILLFEEKLYKRNVLSDFGFKSTDIVYSDNMTNTSFPEQYVVPDTPFYKLIVPNFFFLWKTSVSTSFFFEALARFRHHYISSIADVSKSVSMSYVTRSDKENYIPNARTFVNATDFKDMLERKGVHMIETDTMNSLKPQFQAVLQSKTLIVEMGSAFTINAAFISSDCRIIVLNDIWDYHRSDNSFFQIFRKLMEQRNNTIEVFSHGGHYKDPFTVDIPLFEKKIIYTRTSCVTCGLSDFDTLIKIPHFPVMAISNDLVLEDFYDFEPMVCKTCKCLQLRNLVDPDILYSDVYMNAAFSPSWSHHHEHFKQFITSNTNATSFMEIGANHGELYRLLNANNLINYTILDMYKHRDLPRGVEFIEGNCETFDFTGRDTLILSHVFEHLYVPITFIRNIRKSNVKSVFVSIPNFEALLKDQSSLIIYSQHTFYCGLDYIEYMFSLHGYSMTRVYQYDGPFKSVMIKFELNNAVPRAMPSTDITRFKDIYTDKVSSIRKLVIPPNSYITPAGIYGQYLYFFLEDKQNIIGFLDNNPERHGKTLYGTGKRVFLPDSIKYDGVNILVCDSIYKKEIVAGLIKLDAEANIIYI